MQVLRRRTVTPSGSFTDDGRRAFATFALVAYMFLAVWMVDVVQVKLPMSGWVFWPCVLGYFPFAALFVRASERLFGPLLKPRKAPLVVEESSAELAAWASASLDKKRKP